MADEVKSTAEMTDEQIQKIFDNDKHAFIENDPFRIEKIMYGMFQINDTQMDFVTDLEKELKAKNLYHRDIKQKLKELRKLIHENHTKKLKDGKCWGGRGEEELDSIASDNSVITGLLRKYCGLSNKITFFGGLDASIGQKVWTIHPEKGRLILVWIDSARGIVECRGGGETIGKIMLNCTRLNEKIGSETKETFTIDSSAMFYTKKEAEERLKKFQDERH